MRCGEDGTECAIQHVVPRLQGQCTKTRRIGSRDVPYEWKADCPCCGGAGKLTLTAKGRTILRHCQKCKADQDVLTKALAGRLPGCFRVGDSARPKAPAGIARDAVVGLARRDLPTTAYRVGMLRLAGISAAEAQRMLGIPKSTYYDAMKALGSESGFSD